MKNSCVALFFTALIYASIAGGITAAFTVDNEVFAGLGFLTIGENREIGSATVTINTTVSEIIAPNVGDGAQGNMIKLRVQSKAFVLASLNNSSELKVSTPNGACWQWKGAAIVAYNVSQTFPDTTVWENLTVGNDQICIKFWHAGEGVIRGTWALRKI